MSVLEVCTTPVKTTSKESLFLLKIKTHIVARTIEQKQNKQELRIYLISAQRVFNAFTIFQSTWNTIVKEQMKKKK